MIKIKAFFQVIRLRNLIIILLTQFLLWLLVLQPSLSTLNMAAALDLQSVLLLIVSTLSIAAAGYIINDYFDVSIDLINKPDQVVIEKIIPRRVAIMLHSLLNMIGILSACFVAWKLSFWSLMIIPIVSSLLLWLYATDYKGSYVFGNLIVALLTVLSILIIPVAEKSIWPLLGQSLWIHDGILNPWMIISTYCFFAFLLTWVREIVKDMEDYKGDFTQGCKTLPIQLGLSAATHWAQVLLSLAVLCILISIIVLINSQWWLLSLYLGVTILPLMIYILYSLPKNISSEHYYKMSQLLKWVMIMGILALAGIFLLLF